MKHLLSRTRRPRAHAPLWVLPLVPLFHLVVGCGSDTVVEPPPAQNQPTTIVRDLPADTGNTGHFTLFRLADSSVVPITDSATTRWDLGFNGTTIITNGGDRGPGNGGALLLTSVDFDTLGTAPAEGYTAGAVAKEWYTYTGATGVPPHTILIKPGVVIVLRTADGRHAKLQLISYYKGGPVSPSGTEPGRMYTFRYFLRTDGTRTLRNA